ncbi:hypothetical protein [Paenarthrobacter nicotinovorans]|uniref:hypothetical protein n=1 Tax=Paenarthrobacter nicotinovorans TaxID=29320 RepID=UPI0039A73B41
MKASNNKLAQMLKRMTDKLEEGCRELMATGWDACAEHLIATIQQHPPTIDELRSSNPYRKPVIDLSGAIICTTGDDQ